METRLKESERESKWVFQKFSCMNGVWPALRPGANATLHNN